MANTTLLETKELLKNLADNISVLTDKISKLEESSSHEKENFEAIAAKIINNLSEKIDQCICAKELSESSPQTLTKDKGKEKVFETILGLKKYSPPNHGVGNEELGSSSNPQAIIWTFKK